MFIQKILNFWEETYYLNSLVSRIFLLRVGNLHEHSTIKSIIVNKFTKGIMQKSSGKWYNWILSWESGKSAMVYHKFNKIISQSHETTLLIISSIKRFKSSLKLIIIESNDPYQLFP